MFTLWHVYAPVRRHFQVITLIIFTTSSSTASSKLVSLHSIKYVMAQQGTDIDEFGPNPGVVNQLG